MYLFLANASYSSMQSNGANKEVTESYLIESDGISEAEKRAIEEMSVESDFEVKSVVRKKAFEILPDSNCDKWYEVTINIITLDEIKGIEKRKKGWIYIQKGDIANAISAVTEHMRGSMTDYEIVSAKLTNIIEYFKYNLTEE